MKPIMTLLAVLVLAPIAALAEEGGMVTLDIGGAAYEFPLEAGQSDWNGYEAYGAVFGSVNIYTRPTDEATRALFKQLTLGFSLEKAGTVAPEFSLNRMVDGELAKLFGSKDTSAEVTVEAAVIDGDYLILSGSFSGDLGTSRNYGGDIDLSDPVPVSGRFEVTLLSIKAE